jgi:S1-C subfamily serine protease
MPRDSDDPVTSKEREMRRLGLWNVWLIGCCLTASSATADGPPVPNDLVVVRAQPAVFSLQVRGNLRVTYPETCFADMALLEEEYTAGRAGAGPAVSRTDSWWGKLATDPAKYLRASVARETVELKDSHYQSGTGFAVSREGILLTNAHVVADPPKGWAFNDLDSALVNLNRPLHALLERLTQDFKGPLPQSIRQRVVINLVEWMAQQSSAEGKFTRVDVVLEFVTDLDERRLHSDPHTVLEFLADPPPFPRTAPAEVLKVGEPIPGKDVAVLRISRAQAEDRLICLPLGDSGDVLAGAKVHALGFPGIAFDQRLMDPSAAFRVSSRDGEISQTKAMKGGWDALEMTAAIFHGDSGGPLLDGRGVVIGLNVGGTDQAASRVTLAVPINVAREFLADAGTIPDPGPLTARWEDSLRLYDAGRFADALAKLLDVEAMQTTLDPADEAAVIIGKPVPGVVEPRHFLNPYMLDMQQRCIRKAQIPNETVRRMRMDAYVKERLRRANDPKGGELQKLNRLLMEGLDRGKDLEEEELQELRRLLKKGLDRGKDSEEEELQELRRLLKKGLDRGKDPE